MPEWGPLGSDVYRRTYSRRKPDGTSETWADTVARVVAGNLALVPDEHHLPDEAERLTELLSTFAMVPGGRHLWVTGVPGRHYLSNCHRAGWGDDLATHFVFLFDELMKGGGVGGNYSDSYLAALPTPAGPVELRVTADERHPDHAEFAHRLSPPSSAGAVAVPDSRHGWTAALKLVLDTAQAGGGRVDLDVSDVRPRGSTIHGFGGTASGPGPLVEMLHAVAEVLNANVGRPLTSMAAMDICHAIASCVVAGNVRRSARMSIKHWADEDILDFIRCKEDTSEHWSTNISVEVDDAFFEALDAGDPQACVVFDAVIDGMLTNGEPGFFNSSTASVGERGDVRCTNPCGELALEEFEPCVIGSLNLAVLGTDLGAAAEAARLMARFLVRATHGDIENPRQREVVDRNRRIGVGLFGFQEWAAAHGVRYSDIHTSKALAAKLAVIADHARTAASAYAAELDIPAPIKVTSIQPTGSTAQLSGHTQGIHPVYARYFRRRVRYAEGDPLVAEHAARGRHVEPCRYTANTSVVSMICRDRILDDFDEDLIEQADEIDADTMMATQAFVQRHFADNAVSFSVNVPEGMDRNELRAALLRWLPELKGTTVMVDGSRPQAPFERIDRETYDLLEAGGTAVVSQAMDECASGACPVR